MSVQALPYIILLGFLFGSTLIASRFGIGQYEPTTYIGLRMVIASMAHVCVYWFMTNRRFPRDIELWKRASVLGVLGTAVPMTSVVSSLQYQSSGITSLVLTTSPAVTVVLAHFLLPDESLTLKRIVGVTLALGGAMMLVLSGEDGLSTTIKGTPIGYVLVSVAVACSATMTIYARKYLSEYNPFDVASVRMITAGMIVMPLSLFTVGFDISAVTGEGYVALLYATIIGTFFAFILSFYNIKRFGATPAIMVSYVTPIVASIGGVIILKEEFTTTMLVSMFVIISGIAMIQESGVRKVVATP